MTDTPDSPIESAPRSAVGCMTGTSLDALDATLVIARGRGLSMRVEAVASRSRPLGATGAGLRRLAEGHPVTAGEVARLALELGELHADGVRELIASECGGAAPSLIAVHGQTVYHAPPASWQLINPWPIARRTGCPVVFDLRGADLSAGGQGAPITPLADWVMFRSDSLTRAVVNLGGFCNLTILPRGAGPELIRGADVCACNHVLDGAARAVLGMAFDPEGRHAAAAESDPRASGELARALRSQASSGRSLGTGDECVQWLSSWRGKLGKGELLASAADGVGAVVAGALDGCDQVILAGGGTRNAGLVRAISRRCAGPVELSDSLGVPASWRESAQMGVLGLLCRDRVPITLPTVTGVSSPAPVAGAWIHPG